MAGMPTSFNRAWWFLAPGLVIMTAIVSVPLFMAARYSVHRVFLYRFDQQDFVGLANYLRAFRDPLYIKPVKTTVVFTLGCLVLSMALSSWHLHNASPGHSLWHILTPFLVGDQSIGLAAWIHMSSFLRFEYRLPR